MANTLAPRGLINPRLKTGGEPRTHTVHCGLTYASNFLPGQLVQRRADGRVIHLAATDSSRVAGVVMSYLANPNGQSGTADLSEDTAIQIVSDLMNTEWELQLSCANTDARSFIGNCTGIYATAYLNLAHAAATAADGVTRPFAPYIVGELPDALDRMFRVIDVVIDQKNDLASADPRVVVEFNPGAWEKFNTTVSGAGI